MAAAGPPEAVPAMSSAMLTHASSFTSHLMRVLSTISHSILSNMCEQKNFPNRQTSHLSGHEKVSHKALSPRRDDGLVFDVDGLGSGQCQIHSHCQIGKKMLVGRPKHGELTQLFRKTQTQNVFSSSTLMGSPRAKLFPSRCCLFKPMEPGAMALCALKTHILSSPNQSLTTAPNKKKKEKGKKNSKKTPSSSY